VSPKTAASLRLKVVTPRRLLVEADVEDVQIPTVNGLIGVWPGHRPLVTALGRGRLSYRQGGEEEAFEVDGGTAEIQPERVLVFTRIAEE
jgi:F-type H+-transporting ATPase subunit epsilon